MIPENIDFRELIEQNLDYVRRLVYGMLGNAGQVDDLVQEIFVRVIRGYSTFKQESSFQTWVYRIATRVVYDDLEQRKNRPVLCPVDEEEVPAKQETPAQELLRRERETVIRAALEKLSPPLRTTVVLYFFESLSPEQIAAVEECTTATVYWRLHEAKKQLKGPLEKFL